MNFDAALPRLSGTLCRPGAKALGGLPFDRCVGRLFKLCKLLDDTRLKAMLGLGGIRLWLKMSRGEITDYLGLTIETMSHAIGKPKNRNIISLMGSDEVVVLDNERLRRIGKVWPTSAAPSRLPTDGGAGEPAPVTVTWPCWTPWTSLRETSSSGLPRSRSVAWLCSAELTTLG